MRHPGIYKKKQFSLFSLFLLFIGISGMIFAVTIDFFKASMPNFGINQLAGFVISTIIALAGLRKIAVLKARIWDGLLLLVYSAGILFMGLRYRNHGHAKSSGMLHNLSFSFSDAAINILGFIPLGYLMMSYFISSDRKQKKVPVICLSITACIGISFIIELSQYYIPGRSSSLSDLLFNGLGAFGGIIYYLLEKRLSRNN
ncbi:MAG: VanZ family protein [Desulfobacterales bacterium]|nr:VanZ family protein [Desulfobacterales bacterium]